MVLSASASYIAVPAAMRVALPEANPSIYLTLSLGVTFPFNLTLGIPLYLAVATRGDWEDKPMQTHKAKRVEITIEKVMERRLTDALQEAGVTGYTILPVRGGSGRSGEWSRVGQVSRGRGHGAGGLHRPPRPARRAARGRLRGGRAPYRRGLRDRLRRAAGRAVLTFPQG